jgi:hypothetical protein
MRGGVPVMKVYFLSVEYIVDNRRWCSSHSVLGFGFRDLEEFVSFNELWSFSDIEMGDLTNIFNDDGEGRVIERIVTKMQHLIQVIVKHN